jgi:glyoxylase I family protein
MIPSAAGLQIDSIDHCSVIITDVERSRRFYRDLLGLPEIPKPSTFDFVALWFDLGHQHIHLLLKEQADTKSARHFALRVKDCAAARQYFQAHGVEIQETVEIPGADRFFILDPDGNRIEIIEWKRPYRAVATPVEVYTPKRKAEFLLSNAVDAKDYARAVRAVRKMGLDPAAVPHRKPRGA